MEIKSSAFEHFQNIPTKYTCEGENISPPLQFFNIPANAKSLVLIVDDPDAPMGTFDHWIGWNLEPNQTELKEGQSLPNKGKNSYGVLDYKGPCPPPPGKHRYFFKLYALSTLLDLPEGISKKELEKAIEPFIIEKTELVGLYKKVNS